MWILALSTALAQEPECTSAFGDTACGYDCEAAFGEVRCASVPYGACKAAFGKVVCGPEPVGFPLPTNTAKATCEAAYGEVACGYGCVAAFGQVKCAQTPQGRCNAAYGEVTCFDPRPTALTGTTTVLADGRVVVVLPPGSAPASEPATCRSAYGQTACGYHCEAAYGQVKCAQTPQGRCTAAYGEVTCWDPR